MKRVGHLFRRSISAGVLMIVGMSPFVVYTAARITNNAEAPAWPAPVAVTTADANGLTSLAVLATGRSPVLVQFPLETSLDVPSGGRLRAATAYKIGGAPLLARSLSATIGTDIPFYAHWIGPGLTTITGAPETNAAEHVSQITALLAQRGGTLPIRPAPGQTREGAYYSSYVLETFALRALIEKGVSAAPLPSVTPTSTLFSPSPSPTGEDEPDRARISITVLNQGAASGAATRLTRELREKGYDRARVGDAPEGTVTGNYVYYNDNRELALIVAADLDFETTVAEAPSGYTRSSDVIVVLGEEPSARSTSTRRSTPRPTSTESVTTVG